VQAMAWQAIGNFHRLRGHPAEARRAFEAVLNLGSAIGGPITLAAAVRLGQVLMTQGQLRLAEQVFLQAIGQVGEGGSQLALYTGEAHIRLGDIYREWDQLERAVEHVLKGLELARGADNAPAALTGYFTLAHVRLACGELALARAALLEARLLAARLDYPHLIERVSAHQAWLDYRLGNSSAAIAWADGYAASRPDLVAPTELAVDFQDTLLVRIRLHQGDAPAAQAAAQQVLESARSAGRCWTVAQALVLATQAHQASGNQAEAQQALAAALGQPTGGEYRRLFLDEGEPMRLMLAELAQSSPADEPAPACARQLLEAFAAAAGPRSAPQTNPPSGNHALVEPLTGRELEVLRLLAEGRSNRDIAEAMVISVGTVKSHINRILGKLAVRSRTQAAARARTLALI
ncbi:MAG: LuxR C-terminal-related transcriptional regulator, partial [Anaerolineales bacterium]